MFIYKQPTEIGGDRGKQWKIVMRVRADELATYKPERSAPVNWIPNSVAGYVTGYTCTPSGKEFMLSIEAVEDTYQL